MERLYSSEAYIKELSRRFKQYRIDFPISQKELSERSGVSLRSIQYFEGGKGIQLESLIKLLMALGLDLNLDMLIPDVDKRPSAYLTREKKQERKRVGHKKNVNSKEFRWGDEK